MDDRNTREFAERMKQIRLEDEARERVLDCIAKTARADARTSPHYAERPPARTVTQRAPKKPRKLKGAIAAGIAACALAAGIGFAGLAMPAGPDAGSGMLPFGGQKAFALEAYAQGDLSKEPYHTTALTENALSYNVGGYFGHWQDLETGEVLDDTLGYWFRFDLTCIGNDVVSYKYEIEGDGAYFGIIDEESTTPAALGKYSIVDKTLTIDSGNQGEYGTDEGSRYIPGIIVSLPMDGEFAAAYAAASGADAAQHDAMLNKMESESATAGEKIDDGALQQTLDESNARLNEASAELDRQIETHAAARISGCKLRVTATYVDGTTETKVYEITPVDGYDGLLSAFLAERAQWTAESEDDSVAGDAPAEPHLYNITEVKE